MKKEIYDPLVLKLDELGVIRKEQVLMADGPKMRSTWMETRILKPILSDVFRVEFLQDAFEMIIKGWDLSKPFLIDQSDELWNFILENPCWKQIWNLSKNSCKNS